ncbi:MAG TPA: heme lyase CcmF/NrfE family subunit [Candidatus Polarisedimenticolaceae bacterium]|nr:heme lyase CcmF/NrfE family subunit [Candidatus Polarisedimenticolaceae bacterium]
MNAFGHFALLAALLAAAWAATAAFLGAVGATRGLQRSAERALLGAAGFVACAVFALEWGLVHDDFRLDYVYHYSSHAQPLVYKVGALWGGQSGSLLFWSLILSVMGVVMVATNRDKNRALMPGATAVVGLVLTFFLLLVNVIESPFVTGPLRADGVGLNPQLKNYWMLIHPPCLYLGYVGFTVPFAFAIAALLTRRTGDIWFRTTRRWTMFAWFFLGTGILLGSYWAYVELGWGGYWAWDPVENASLMPWLTGTAFLHSVMIQEKKRMLKIWNMVLIILTFCLSIFGTFLTRSGIISSVHAFATSNIGPAFGIFLGLVFFSSLALLILRLESLRTEARLESLLSRESSFVFNNLILVGIAATVLLLTTFPLLSEALTGRKVTMGPPIFNTVNVPWALCLLFLAGVGPLIAWRKASRENLRRNFTVPALTGIWMLVAVLVVDPAGYWALLRDMGTTGFFDGVKGFYPVLTFGIGAFVLGTLSLEFYRGVRARRHQHGETVPVAASRMMWRNKRRWGGYIVHLGVVVIFAGIAGSSSYQKETVGELSPGESLTLDGYRLHYVAHTVAAEDDHLSTLVRFDVTQDGRPAGTLRAEQRAHVNLVFPVLKEAFTLAKAVPPGPDRSRAALAVYGLIAEMEGRAGREVKTPSTEVGISASMNPLRPTRFGEDLYVIPLAVDPRTGRANVRVFVNPMVNFIWLGGLILILGAHLSVLPDAAERKRLRAAMELEERAVA